MFNLFLFLCPGVDSGISKLELKQTLACKMSVYLKQLFNTAIKSQNIKTTMIKVNIISFKQAQNR
jgi:hypothetical protein